MAQLYSLVPLAQGPFSGIDPVSRLIFGLIWDRYKVSSYNVTGSTGDSPWYDFDVDEVFCVYSQAALAELAGVSERTVRRSLDCLREAGLIWWRKATYRGTCRYYIDEHTRAYLRGQ